MQPIPLELPLKASEAASLADVLLDQVEGRALTDDARSRLASRLGALPRPSFTVFPGSLQKDPIHPSVFYIAVDPAADPGRTMLLRVALASSPSSGLFPKSLLIGRMRTNSGREIVINAISFTPPEDRDNIRTFVERVDRAFAPRPQGTLAALEVADGGPDAFQAFRAILKARKVNVASVFSADPAAALWAAIVGGWREGYTTATSVRAGQAIDPVFTKYSVAADVVDEVYDSIQLAKGPRARFDLEVSFADAPSPTTPKELFVGLDRLKSRGRTPQFVAPNLGQSPSQQLDELAEVARSFNTTLSIQSSGNEPPEVVEQIGKATGGRVNYKIRSGTDAAAIVRLADQLNL